ncbi:MAG: class B sortase [Evtepia sp.]|nr:class B sortase [Evtepia sp.]
MLAFLVCLTLFLFSGFQLFSQWMESRHNSGVYSELRQESLSEPEVPEDLPSVDFDVLRKINQDIVAWLYCPDGISYPVVQSDDNSYYLDHLFDGSRGTAGCLFLDNRSSADFSDRHSVIYGHHMKDGSMFGTLEKYREQSYYDEHSVLYLITPKTTYRVALFTAYTADTASDAWRVEFSDDRQFSLWLESTVSRSFFESDVIPEADDPIVTLSTCSYDFEDARFVVLGTLTPFTD